MPIKKEIIINSDIKKVWKIFSQIEKWPEWGGYIKHAKWLSEKKWKRGSRFIQIIKGFGIFKDFKSDVTMLNVMPAKYVEWTGKRRLMRGVHSFKFIKTANKTKVVNEEYFEGLLSPFIFPFIKKNFGVYFEQFNQGLKKEAEK